MTNQRVAMAHTLKTCAPRIFASIGIAESTFSGKASERAESEELKALLKWNVDKPGYPALAPILYAPGSGRDLPFQNPVLPLVSRVLYLQPSTHLTTLDFACDSFRSILSHLSTSRKLIRPQMGGHAGYDGQHLS